MPNQLLWTCKVCKTTVPTGSQKTHLSSESHSRNLITKASEKQKQQVKKTQRTPHLAPTYTCTSCNITITAASEASHIAGRKHRAKAAAPKEPSKASEPINPPSTTAEPAIKQADSTTTKKPFRDPGIEQLIKLCKQLKPQWWTCNVCSVTMYATAQQAHQSGKCTGKRAAVITLEPFVKKGGPLSMKKLKPALVGEGLQKRLDGKMRAKEQSRGKSIGRRRDGKEEGRKGEELE